MDAKGIPIAGAKVGLMSGELDEKAWREDVTRNMRGSAIGSGGVSVGKGVVNHKWVTTGADGRWTIWYVREEDATEEGKRWAGPLSVGAMAGQRLSALRPLSKEEVAGERVEVDVPIE